MYEERRRIIYGLATLELAGLKKVYIIFNCYND